MINEFAYLISSCEGYEPALYRLLDSMAGIPSGRQIIYTGGCQLAGGNKVTHNSFEYTALIEFVLGEPTGFEHVFLLHDTMELSPETDSLIRQAHADDDATAAVPGGQCNLCLFRTDYLLSQRERILAMRNCTKLEAVQFEGALFKLAPRQALYPNAVCETDCHARAVYNGAVRIREWYKSVGIVKHKANYGQSLVHWETRA